jgi:hypothetical protein
MSLANHIKIPDTGIPLIRMIESERMLQAYTPLHEVGPTTDPNAAENGTPIVD